MKLNIAVLFGHISCEHDISIITACQAIKHLDKNKYNVIPIYVTKNNKYITSNKLTEVSNYPNNVTGKEVFILPNSNYLYKKGINGLCKHLRIDVALLCFHGNFGENGAIQGLFELNNIPYTSTDIIGSSCGANKIVFKQILKGLNVPTAKSLWLTDKEFHLRKDKVINAIFKKLGNSVIIKPNTLGSSIGISVCNNQLELIKALRLAFELDSRVLVEEYITDFKEVNIATIYNGSEHIFSEIEEAKHSNKFLSFTDKYISGSKTKVTENKPNAIYLGGNLKAELSPKQKTQIKVYTKRVYDTLNLKGIVRFDFMVTNNKIYLNEINTIPGSLANYLFKPKGYSYKKLLTELINSAIVNNSKKNNYIKTFESSVLNGSNNGIKK